MNRFNYTVSSGRNYIFLIVLISVLYYFKAHEILFLHPQGIHFFRQTDSLAFVSNYYNFGMNFFEPGVLNVAFGDGKAASEFPILYFFTAFLYKLFGEHVYFLRFITLSIVCFGFYNLFQLLKLLLNDIFYAFIFTFLFFSSTVLIYYANNFIPDASSLGLALAGWYYFYLHFKGIEKNKNLYAAFLLFTFSSLLKVTSLINPIAAVGSLMLLQLFSNYTLLDVIKQNLKLISLFITTLVIVYAWNSYVIEYNELNNSPFFLVKARPIWDMEKPQIDNVWNHIYNYWYSSYYPSKTFKLFAVIIILGIIAFKKFDKFQAILTVVISIGTIAYGLLFYEQFQNHDYYCINVLPALIFIIISSFMAVRLRFPFLSHNLITRISLLIICLLGFDHVRNQLTERYQNTNDPFASVGYKLDGINNYLNDLYITKSSKVIVLSDYTPNGSLYFLGRKGWTIPETNDEGYRNIESAIKNGADFAIITDEKYLKEEKLLSMIGKQIGKRKGVYFFKISN